jgi:regulatory protein
MQTITQITEHPRKPGRYVIDVDGREFAIVTADALAASRARIGVVVDDLLAAHLREANELTAAYDRALNLLAFRARSARELHRRLVQKGVTSERADRVIAKLREVGLIDDTDFARQLARSKMSAGASRRRVHQELFKRGVAREVADEAVEQVVEDEGLSDADSIQRIARKKWGTLNGLDEPTRCRRLYGFLARRGFDSDEISRVVRQLAGEAAESDAQQPEPEVS